MMESFLDMDQFLLGDKPVTQRSQSQIISLVNTDIGNTVSSNDGWSSHNLSTELKFNDAWDLLNAMESDSHASFDSIFNTISTMEKPLLENNTDNLTTINTPGLDVTALFSNIPSLPFDVSTPDVDTTILTSDTPEFFSNSMIEKSDLSISVEAPIPDSQTQDKELDCGPHLANTTNQSILTLNIGQSLDNVFTGNGAQLQLKRKASNQQTVQIENVKTEHKHKNENIMTIIIKFGNDSQEDVPSPKRPKCEDKYDEMRRKNNEASRRCRQNRKSKHQEMEILEEQLEKDNKRLSETVSKLEKEIQQTKAQFMNIFKSKPVK